MVQLAAYLLQIPTGSSSCSTLTFSEKTVSQSFLRFILLLDNTRRLFHAIQMVLFLRRVRRPFPQQRQRRPKRIILFALFMSVLIALFSFFVLVAYVLKSSLS